MLEPSEIHKKCRINRKDLKSNFSVMWKQAKEFIRKYATGSLCNQTPLPAGNNPKGTQTNEIWQMDGFILESLEN